MSTIEIVLEDALLAALDARAARQDGDRSALIRNAVRDHLHRLKERELEEQERLAYERVPDTLELDDWKDWEKIVAWRPAS
ncbi:MAG: ribbon-helix-helix protein, CopG family [Bryobacteraceae bacterium]